MSDTHYIAKLSEARVQLDHARSSYKIRLRHLFPDTVLYALAIDVAEHARAVGILVGSEVPRAAMVNARAAFESALDALLLVSDPSRYDERGMYARACELVEQENLIERMNAADAAIGKTRRRPALNPEEVVAEEGEFWSQELAGAKERFLEILKDVRSTSRWKKHWSGLGSLKHVAVELDRLEGPGRGLKEMADALYGLQSMHSHPRPRIGMREIKRDAEGSVEFQTAAADPKRAAGFAFLSCTLAKLALDRKPGDEQPDAESGKP